MLFCGQGRGLGFTSERKSQTLEKGLRSRMRHPTAFAVHVLSAQTGGNPQNGELPRVHEAISFSHLSSRMYVYFESCMATNCREKKWSASLRQQNAWFARLRRLRVHNGSIEHHRPWHFPRTKVQGWNLFYPKRALQSIPRDRELFRANSGLISGSRLSRLARFGAQISAGQRLPDNFHDWFVYFEFQWL